MIRCQECFNFEAYCTCNVVAHPCSVQAFNAEFERSLTSVPVERPALRLVEDKTA